MNTKLLHPLLGVLALAVAASASAQTSPPARRPGQWEIRQGPAGGPVGPAVRICMSADEAGGEFKGLGKGPAASPSTCAYERLSTSSTEVRWRNVCKSDGDTLTMEGRAYDIRPDSFKVDMAMSGLGSGAGTVHADARWVGADCAGRK